MSISEVAAWNAVAEIYEANFESFTLQFAQHTLETLTPSTPGRLLDIAAGAGGMALMAAQNQWRVTAIDFSPAFVTRIRNRAEHAGMTAMNLEALIMDGMNLAFPDRAFDAVCSVFGVMLFTQRFKAYKEIVRVLRPGGIVALAVWGPPSANEAQILMSAAMDQAELPSSAPPAWAALTAYGAGEEELREVGFISTTTHTVEGRWNVPSVTWLWDVLPRVSPVSAMLFEGLSTDEFSRLEEAYKSIAQSQYGDGSFALSATAHIITGLKPEH